MKLHVIDGSLHELHRDQLEAATRLETLIRGKGMQEVKAQKVIVGRVKRTRTEGQVRRDTEIDGKVDRARDRQTGKLTDRMTQSRERHTGK